LLVKSKKGQRYCWFSGLVFAVLLSLVYKATLTFFSHEGNQGQVFVSVKKEERETWTARFLRAGTDFGLDWRNRLRWVYVSIKRTPLVIERRETFSDKSGVLVNK